MKKETEKKELFFSIIVPAHNEEKYIEVTLQHLQNLDYPKDAYEVIVIENGSTDKTATVAKKFETNQCKVFSFPSKGVAFARNRGIEKSNPKAEWVIFLDADTLLKPTGLRKLADFLTQPTSKKYSMGTSSIKPTGKNIMPRFYFLCCDLGHYLTKTAYGAFFVVRKDVLKKHRFDEALSITEDAEICNEAHARGKFFFLTTSEVSTSTRRYDKTGWAIPLLHTIRIAYLPLEERRKIEYEVIR